MYKIDTSDFSLLGCPHNYEEMSKYRKQNIEQMTFFG